MSVKLRILRLEESQKAKADAVSHEVTAERSRQTIEWLNATVKHITDGTPMPPPLPRDMTRSPAQEKANKNARIWLNKITLENEDELRRSATKT